ncbi:MAG: biotin--[acetyl-CoA-carboxylase] ligase [Fimbriimonadales bacterium]
MSRTCRVEFLKVVDSTQRVAQDYLTAGDTRWDAVCADHQTAGRGRQGAHWYDAPAQSLLVSLILREVPSQTPVHLLGVTVALASALALEHHFPAVAPVQLKFPNDLILRGRKVGGVLVERVHDGFVAGVGINLRQEQFPETIAHSAISVKQALGQPDFPDNRLPLIQSLWETLHSLLRHTPDDWHRLWGARDTTAGRAYQALDLPHQPIGTALEVSPDFRLCLQLPDGSIHITMHATAVSSS